MGGPGDPFTYSTIEVPTVVGLLHNILTQYPDNGQIIKELVQNAEDAGATRVEMVHFTDPLQQPQAKEVVQRFIQGPGLCLYNDATFSEEDWHGIRKLSDSIKKDNPLQVGQFGLGFKSVFHLTDFVTIISGTQVLFMDPSEPEDKMCRSLTLDKLTEVLPDPSSHQAFEKYFTTTHSQANGSFPGTLFWFPLRQSASRISDTVYTPGHVERLFGSFSVEANVCLTFLKSLEKITLGKAGGGKITVTHSMKITSQGMEEVRCKRRSFRQNLIQCKGSPSTALSCSYEATLQTTVGGANQKQTMRIFHFLPGKEDTEWMTWMGRNKDKHVPLVGVAVPVVPPAAPGAKGHIFSFLPLPPDPSNQTALPIQVNGAFILSQNRRQVKWRTSESSNQEPDVLWNEDLVSKVVARAYLELLKELLKETEGSISADTWYTFLPSLQGTTGRWHKMARQVLCGLLDLPIIATEVRGFLPPREVLTTNSLSTLRPAVSGAVRKVLCGEKLPLATLPDHVQESFSVLGQQLSPVTPQLLRKTLRGIGGLLEGEESRQDLLCYAAMDKQYHDLRGLPLLPLQNRSWATFNQRGSDSPVYLCTKREAKALLGLEGQMASTSVAQPVCNILRDVAQSGQTQLCPFQPQQHGPGLLLQSATHLQQNQPSQQQVGQWLCEVWGLLQHISLHSVEHIPLLPTTQPPNAVSLTSLSSPVVVQGRGSQLSTPQIEALKLLGVVVVPPLPSHIRHIELQGYLSSPDRHGTTQALSKVVSRGQQMQAVTRFNTQKAEHQRQAMASLIETSSIEFSLRNFLTKLSMFKAQDMFSLKQDSCLEGVNTIAPELVGFPVSYPETLLTPTQPQERALALALGARQLSKEDLCIRALRSCHSDEYVSALVRYILGDPQLVGSSSVLQQLKNTRFVPNVAGLLCHPSELYDPEDEDHCVLIGEIRKPDDSFSAHYPLLRSLGLRKVREMPRDDLICIIKDLENKQLSKDNKTRKSLGLLHAMNHRPDCPQVCQAVLGVPFVYGAFARPCGYPTNLEWATPPEPLVPQGLRSHQYNSVLGSTTALVECYSFPSVASTFGWVETPAVESVIQHLKNLAAAYQVTERDKYFNLIKQTYRQLSEALSAGGAPLLASLKTECCVFTERGFRTPDEVYICPGDEDLHLLPYLHMLPFELRESEQLFSYLGCAGQQSPSLLLAVLGRVRARHQGGGSGIGSREVEQDRRLVMSVLDRLQHHSEELPGPLLVPVKTRDNVLELAEVEHVAYTEGLAIWLDSDELGVKVVHECMGASLARALGVAPLQSFLSAGGEAVMEWGQREPLTTRLRNLLQQYRDGVSILKEMVQNADDAGATTIHLLYDERQNEDAQTLLLGPGMEQCQGPALWVYNDALFSEQDFKNLREVGAGTKELHPTKIGKFGLGFCSVYNLTDVPSFISGSSYVVFDPHMTHLSNSTNSPGLRFNFTDRRNSYMLRTLSGQFQPFAGVFGCDVQGRGSFEGTLFRLPFRTAASKISNTCYSHGDMVQLLKMFSDVVGQLLLFTQHVASISVFHLSASASTPSEMVELFHATRSRCQPILVPGLSSIETDVPQSVLERAAALFSKQQHEFKWKGTFLSERSTAEVSVQYFRGGANLCGLEEGEWNTTWVISWHSGSGSASRLAEALGGKALPLAAVAVPVREGQGGWQPLCLTDLPSGFYCEGHFHCFLPLPVQTLLPLHINGVLEVASDRTNLLTKTEDDRHAISWNTTLAGDAIVRAHLGLADALRHLGLCAESPYHSVWPVVHPGTGTLVEELTKGFYHALEQEDLALFRCSNGDWHPLSRCCFLEQDFLQMPQLGDIAFEFLQTYLHSLSELRLVRLPQHIHACLSKQVLSQHVVTEEAFFLKYFVPNMLQGLVSPEKRDQLTLRLLDAGHPCLELLRPLSCIPTQPHGTLVPPAHLVSPRGRIARMFSVDDERFPAEEFINSSKRFDALARLGMNTNKLRRELVVERAETVAGLKCSHCACYRVRQLLLYMSELRDTEQDELGCQLKSVPFLPVMPKPKGWSIAWHGVHLTWGETQSCYQHMGTAPTSLVFDCPSALCWPTFKSLVGSCHLLLDQSFKEAPQSVLQRLGVITRALDLPLRSVLEQLSVLSASLPEKENVRMCHSVYDHLEDFISHVRRGRAVKSGNLDELGKLKEKKILLTRYGFKEPKLFAVYSEVDCAPNLFSVCAEGLEKYRCLMETLGIKENFDYEAVMKVIQKMEIYSNSTLSIEEVSQVSRLLTVLYKVKESGQQLTQDLHLPDSKGHLRPTSVLCFDDGAELSSGHFFCLHQSITVSTDILEWLGIKSKTRKRLQESSNRLHFGQNEPLTTRLRNILEDYPCDCGIMKELLQNADDAGATEVAFIKDFRQLPDQKLFDPKWASIQGPALSVFNNRGFTEQDLKSIQDLGNSSKKKDPATTGQYGIGFNAVYHLTDAPSFLTRGPQVPNGETLCMFDPHCWYDPAATPQYPGVQFVNLNDLRKDHPHSFIGYLESELTEEGTIFRLPLRATRDSLIVPEKTMTEQDVNEMLKGFQKSMPQCLLFLRNVRKVSIKEVRTGGTCREEYYVEASVSKESHLPALARKYGDMQGARDPCSVDMVRTSYTMNIKDSQGSSSQWLVVQQQGVEKKDSLPATVQDAFRNKALNLLPHGGVALLLTMNSSGRVALMGDFFSTSCYLPLPVRSGLPFSINGHFALNPSRRNLWMGFGDAKSLWNDWLIRELLVPVAVHSVEQFRTSVVSSEDEGYMTEHIYQKKVRVFHHVLPLASRANSEEWKNFSKWFYEEVRDKEYPLFDSFIPETDLQPPSGFQVSPAMVGAREGRKGQLRWHAFHANGDNFPVYFTTISEHDKDHLQEVSDVLRRLGMKLSSEGMFQRLKAADPVFECPVLTPETVLTFLKSWDKDFQDCCLPRVGKTVADTPFLKSSNVLNVLRYISKAKDFSSTSVNRLPLLLTNDDVLGYFSVESPVFLSTFCDLLPAFKREFTSCVLVPVVEHNISCFKNVVKEFTPADFVERLLDEPEALVHVATVKLPLTNRRWVKFVWSFVVHFIKKTYQSGNQMNWEQSKQYILQYLGDWAFYPIKEKNQEFLIPIKSAWQVLNVGGHAVKDSVFFKLPVPFPFCVRARENLHLQEKPYIPYKLQLEASLEDPVAILKLLYFHRESVNNFLARHSRGGPGCVQTQEILEYLGSHCQGSSLSRNKIRSLQIFCDMSGQVFDLLGRSLIVLEGFSLSLGQLRSLCDELSLLLTCKPTSDNITKLYTYIEPNCIIKEIDLYARIILPNMSSLNEETRKFYLRNLRWQLPETEREEEWSEGQQRVVTALKKCQFIEVDGILRTVDNFYDPLNPVFHVMGVSNLPEAWRGKKWCHMLQLAGMIHKVTPEKFLEFASLLPRDEYVKQKSEILCSYLNNHHEDFKSVMSRILDKEFLLPEQCDNLERLIAHYQTESGLVAFSEGVDPALAHVIWSTRSLLPKYAIGVARNLQRQYSDKIKMDTPSVKDILEHIVNLCSSLHEEPEKLPSVVEQVMESIYDYLSKHEDTAFDTLRERDVPVIHIPNHRVFVPISLVVESLEEEILPYLYKAPVVYGKFFSTLRKLGIQEEASSDTYAHVLRMIYRDSSQKRLHPQEARSMRMAMKGLVKHRYKLKDLSISELYLPAKDETLKNSVEMFVADNMELFLTIRDTFQEPVFVGFEALEIHLEESSLLKLLPQRLQPKFLSEACQESLVLEGMEEVASDFVRDVLELIQAEEFKTGVLRIIHHYKLKHSSGLTQEEREEIVALLGRVSVHQVSKIATTITLHNKIAGERNRKFFLVDDHGDQQSLSIYLCKGLSGRLLNICLRRGYSLLLRKWNIDEMLEFQVLFDCVAKPHYIHRSLDESDIKAYSARPLSYCLYACDVGSYLEERFLPFLDNEVYSFFAGEIVCLRKYLCRDERENSTEEEEDEGDIFVIVQVVRQVDRHASCQMLNTYEVKTSLEPPCLVTVRAYQLFRFVRRERKDLMLAQASATEEEDLSEEEIFRKIRKQVKEIWGVDDEREKRRLLRRLLLKWHPDKNPDRVDLCTRVVQYIQSLLGRLERGEHVPDEENESQAPRTNPSEAYSWFFRRPGRRYRNCNSGQEWMPRNNRQERVPRSDLPEAHRWYRQACHDLEDAERMARPSWRVFMCYQAAEKMLLATLYLQDMEEACRQNGIGPLSRTLTSLADLLNNPDADRLAASIQRIVGDFLGPLYPTFAYCPCDRFTPADANQVLRETRELLNVLGQRFV